MTADMHHIATEANAPVAAVCRVLRVPRSTVYARRGRKPSTRERKRRELDVAVRAVFGKHRGRYGSPRVHQEVRRERPVSRTSIAASMRRQRLVAARPKRFRRTTEADPSKVPAPNLLQRNFHRDRPNQAWVGDITAIWTQAGWAYLALLVDLCTRRIVGWAVSSSCDTNLALRALEQAVARHVPPPGLLHHTDRGSTYTADAYRARLRAHDMVCSMSRTGNCWDNAVAESTIGTIKRELTDDLVFEDRHDLNTALFSYIEAYYNRLRIHSTIGYRTPAHYEQLLAAQESCAA